MGRSVYVPSEAAVVVYIDVGDVEDEYEFNELIENLKYEIQADFPSLEEAEGYFDREGTVFLANKLIKVGISEYCGLAAVFVVPEEGNNLAEAFANKIGPKFKKAVAGVAGPVYKKVGSFSNGEGVYEKEGV